MPSLRLPRRNARSAPRGRLSWAPWPTALLLAAAIAVPSFANTAWMGMLFFVALYVGLGLGLNVVVGFAGLLDLGYVAFFATGAYSVALLTSPASPLDMQLHFWAAAPIGLLLALVVGVLLGLPVLPLRGDYLAIVTLGFGEIIRLFLVNQRDITNGSSGVSAIGDPSFFGWVVSSNTDWYYVAFSVAVIVAVLTARLRDSRVGRAWEAIREDEDVAGAMGINTTKYKLMAFAIGALIGGLGGVLYAAFIGFVSPAAFSLQVSIDVLSIVVIGGMGSTWGVIVGSFVIIGIPRILLFSETADFLARFEWLRNGINNILGGLDAIVPAAIGELPPAEDWGAELGDDTRFVIFGALLVAIMVLRPSGIIPSRRRQLEFEHPPEAELSPAEGVA
ncbi:MAG: branched-chain amino acid ABC transporter permease [Dehalococcoidia bacterium]